MKVIAPGKGKIMNDEFEDYKAKLIAAIDAHQGFDTDVDGYTYYWPAANKGHYSSVQLRIIADELDRRNEHTKRR